MSPMASCVLCGVALPAPSPATTASGTGSAGKVASPFCSERCRMADLAQWLNGGYVVPGAPLDSEALDEAAAMSQAHLSRDPSA